jgi:hypothetical protein
MQICGWYLEQLVSCIPRPRSEHDTNLSYRKHVNQQPASTKNDIKSGGTVVWDGVVYPTRKM